MNGLDEMITNEFLSYWGLERLPFPKVCDPADTFLNHRSQQALKRLNQLLYTREIGVVFSVTEKLTRSGLEKLTTYGTTRGGNPYPP